MAYMTNEEIIFNERIDLAAKGIIKYTGRNIRVAWHNDDGTTEEKIIPEPEEIHTFEGWKARGYMVQKGQHAKAAFTIWKAAKKKQTAEEAEREAAEAAAAAANGQILVSTQKPRMFMKKAFWFTREQVQPIQEAESTKRPAGLSLEKLLPAIYTGPMLPACI